MANLTISAQGSAASSSMASSSATTSCTHWDLFINHRGADGERAARYLYRRLTSHGLMRVFFDKEEMEKGQNISQSLPNPFPPLSQLEKLYIRWSGIEHLPQELLKMNNLLHLQVLDCPLLELPFKKIEEEEERERGRELNKLESFHDDGKCMLALKTINLLNTEISEAFFPECVCPNLQHLSLTRCRKLTQIGGLCGLSKLQYLDISRCVILEELPNLEMLISLEELDASDCQRLRSIPGLEQLKKLSHLNVHGCHEMLELSGAKHLMLLKRLIAYDCPKLRWGEGELEHLRQRLKEGLRL